MKPYWVDVASSNLLRVRYRDAVRRLDVIFRFSPETVYTYEDVSEQEYLLVITGPSVGGEFNRLIRSRPSDHPYRRRRA